MVGVISAAAAAAAAKKTAEAAAQDIYSGGKAVAKQVLDKLLVEFGVGFSKYIERTYEKCRYVKTILHRIDPIPIENAYVEANLQLKGKVIAEAKFIAELDSTKNVVVTGLGGTGKSMFLKHVFLELCANPFGRMPLFIEMRDLNSDRGLTLAELIHTQLSALIPGLTQQQLDYGLRKGKFTLLLDALDEVNFEKRDTCSKEIIDLTFKYPECRFLITSRPDDRFSSWNEFYTAKIQPLDKNQVVELIEKIDFDETTKQKFIQEIKAKLMQTHEEFLSNPLLCTMMLMTYNEFEEVPSKMYIFYQRAFDVLFSRHDRTKPGFKRKFYTAFAEDDFEKLFSSFCLVSYLDGKYSFDQKLAHRYAEAAGKLDEVNLNPSDLLRDLSESISILLKEGEVFSFLHRSFQEYFTAVFLADRQLPNIPDLFLSVAARFPRDSVIPLLMEMNKDAFEAKCLKPVVSKLRQEIDRVPGTQPQRLLSIFVSHFHGNSDENAEGLKTEKPLSIIEVISQYYCDDRLVMEFGRSSKNLWDELVRKCLKASGPGVTRQRNGESLRKEVALDTADLDPRLFQQTRLCNCVIRTAQEVEKLDEKLNRDFSRKTDLITVLLEQFPTKAV